MTNLNTRINGTAEERFWAKVSKSPTCWNWTASISDKGYGAFWNEGKVHRAHRFAYSTARGPIPDGMQVDHTCHNRACVNPAHLRLATNKQNIEYRQGPQRNNLSTGVRGVYKSGEKYAVKVKHNGKNYHHGSYATLAEAEEVAIRERAKLFTFPEKGRGAA